MTQIALPDEVASTLASAANSRGCTQEELAAMFILQGLQREDQLQLTPDQRSRLWHSIQQAKRGELVDGDIVMARFDRTLRQIASR